MQASLHGIAASHGIAFGKAYKLTEPDLTFEVQTIQNSDAEINRFHEAINKSKRELEQIRKKVSQEQGEENAAIFDAHILVLHDPEFTTAIEGKIKDDKKNAESALHETATFFIEMFEQLDNEYMRERASDIKDVMKRLLAHLLGKTLPDIGLISEETILIAVDLTPSDAAQMNKQFIKGFVTDSGGRTTHSAIMARTLEVPAIVGTKDITEKVKNGDNLILDGLSGDVFIRPTEEIIRTYEKKDAQFRAQKATWALLKDDPTKTKDGHQVKLTANIGSPRDVKHILENGAEGIGLYRTEFLYMEGTSLPSEEEQFVAYKSVLQKMKDKSVVVRTLDVGGDKQLTYWKLPEEMNPFLGLRAIRLTLQEIDVFRTQLRALLRASVFGNLKIMFPMIATLDEFREAKMILQEEKQKLLQEGIAVSETIEVGMMVEIPSAVILADKFAKEVDFFSIGTNDLIQYTFAADRQNENIAYLYQPYHPALLHFIKLVIDAAHKEGKQVGMCGEMAGDPYAIPLLLGLGLDEFSMGAPSILQTRNQMKELDTTEMKELATTALSLCTAEEVEALVREKLHH